MFKNIVGNINKALRCDIMDHISSLHQEILFLLRESNASYANPITSKELGNKLKVTPSYIRGQIQVLIKMNLVGVRKGRGGGYYLPSSIRDKIRIVYFFMAM